MNTSPQQSLKTYPGVDSTDPELGHGDLRVFWWAALVAILAVSAVVFFKMTRPGWHPATVAQVEPVAQAAEAGTNGQATAHSLSQSGAVVR